MAKKEMGFNLNNGDYKAWITNIKQRIKQSQIKAAVKVNYELLDLIFITKFEEYPLLVQHQRIMYKCKDINEAIFYVQKTMDNNYRQIGSYKSGRNGFLYGFTVLSCSAALLCCSGTENREI